MDVIRRDDAPPFTTKDGSTIREILAPAVAPNSIRNQSLAEAALLPEQFTEPHYHRSVEEIYYILQGRGLMQVEREKQSVTVGDAIAIPPGSIHQITNTGTIPLVFLCCCAPAYSHDDTVMTDLPTDA